MLPSEFDFNTALNQSPALVDFNAFTTNRMLKDTLHAYGADWAHPEAVKFGELMGSAAMQQAGALANKHLPQLHTHDRFGNRLDLVEFHPAYHELMALSIQAGVHSIPWTTDKYGGYLAHSVLSYLKQQVDEGVSCPLTMTFAVVPSLQINSTIAADWLPKVVSNEYDFRAIPWMEKNGVTFGMAMTEPQGGSDVRSNITTAVHVESGIYKITGRKWFCSAPMSDAFLVLAQAPKGLSCFLVPRFTRDGIKNKLYFQRLKDKLGNKSNASSEVEFHGAWGELIGEEGRGVASIMEMVRHTRLDCAIGSAATMHRAVAEAIHHCHYRQAFGKNLANQPLMRNVLADLALESIAATTLAMRIAKGFDDARHNEDAQHFIRIATAVGKFWNTKRAVLVLGEAMECLGGNGYVEESVMPRLYRDVPVNAIWEGSGNIQALDILRAMQKEPASLEALLQYLQKGLGSHGQLDRHLHKTISLLTSNPSEQQARIIAESVALAIQGVELIQVAPAPVAALFCDVRLSAHRSMTWGAFSETPVDLLEQAIHQAFERNE
ncbi:MAG: acyl-CoA dehydrogenase family protein [Chitinophaga sp.]|uniref:acyl-CoA dehydrogenase family protein n=1 Tax=Chitinophaga sp. TaxID=1869181 RepID=UPI0025BEEADF|nr:acyl-CoA dehydrogenase family protein [Chitinophaga sp.]MBV8253365.1 acyl-CoA dehydrogenase family protein [Chitinophaga sp.]